MKTKKPTTVYEIDLRRDWLRTILDALETGFLSVEEMEKEIPWFDGGWAVEHLESIYGIAFVAAQTYILGTVQDVNQIRKISGKEAIDKISCYSDDPQPINNRISRIRLINSIANYYKHHDEWTEWPQNYTTQDLLVIGIDQSTDFPCYLTALQLWKAKDIEKLRSLSQIIFKWRDYVLEKYREI